MINIASLVKLCFIRSFKTSRNQKQGVYLAQVAIKFSSTKDIKNDYEQLQVKDKNGWKQWLDQNHQLKKGIWLKIFKKASKSSSIRYDDALDEALCYGWIDGQRKSNDSESFYQRFTPRRAKSQWSQRNKQIVKRLQQQGRIMPFGLAQIQRAKKDGRWNKIK